MQFRQLWRTSTFRLTVLYGILFSLGTVTLLLMVYWRTTVYLTNRVDGILKVEADALLRSPRPGLRERVIEDLTLNGDRNNIFGLFAADDSRIAGNLDRLPAALQPGGKPLELARVGQFPVRARLIARSLPTGEILVVGRDVSQIAELRSIITSALLLSGLTILVAGLTCGTLLSLAPLRRLRRLQAVARSIADGDLKQRMPTSGRGDELDMFAATVNHMVGEVERLMVEVKGTTEVIAHDLLNPLATAALKLRRLKQSSAPEEDLVQILGRLELVLDRFRAILRIAELESAHRRAGFKQVELADVVREAAELYAPLAEETGVRLLVLAEPGSVVDADPKLLFEALSNLIDNAIKFAGRGSTVQLRTGKDASKPQLIVQDDGPGIPSGERRSVVQRFYRTERTRSAPGSGLGLSVVAAVVRLHGFALSIEDAEPGVRIVIDTRPANTPTDLAIADAAHTLRT
jgi:signal transduction histidine kinase